MGAGCGIHDDRYCWGSVANVVRSYVYGGPDR